MPVLRAVVGAVSVYKFVATVKEYTLLESAYGTYQIIKNSKPIAHPATQEDAWQRISWLTGKSKTEPKCWDYCKIHNCNDCDRYHY